MFQYERMLRKTFQSLKRLVPLLEQVAQWILCSSRSNRKQVFEILWLTCTWPLSSWLGSRWLCREETWLSMLAYTERRIGDTTTPAKLGTWRWPWESGGRASVTIILCTRNVDQNTRHANSILHLISDNISWLFSSNCLEARRAVLAEQVVDFLVVILKSAYS